MIKFKSKKRTKRELKYIDIIANFIWLMGEADDGEIPYRIMEMLKYFKLSNYDIKLIQRVLSNFDYYFDYHLSRRQYEK